LEAGKGRTGKGGALKVGPGGKALLKLRESDASGKVDLWVDDRVQVCPTAIEQPDPRRVDMPDLVRT